MKVNLLEKSAVGILSAAALLSAGPQAFAEGLNVQTYSPTIGTRFGLTETARALSTASDAPRWYQFTLSYDYFNDPLIRMDSTHSRRTRLVVDDIQTLNLVGTVEFNRRFALAVDLPLNWVRMAGQERQTVALGDVGLLAKTYLTTDATSFWSTALVAELRLPTGGGDLFVSNATVGVGAHVALERRVGPVELALNAGFRHNPGARYQDVDYRNTLPLKAALSLPVHPQFSLNAEAAGAVTLPLNGYQNPGEFYGGVNYRPDTHWSLSAGASLGRVNRQSSADHRVLLGLTVSLPGAKAATPALASVPAPVPQPPAPPRVEFTPKRLVIRDEIHFEHDSAALKPQAKELLAEVAAVLAEKNREYKAVVIDGHTNELGTDQYNLGLSKARAASVRSYLVSQGIPAEKLLTQAFGESKPKDLPKGTPRPTKLELNRRVEFEFVQ